MKQNLPWSCCYTKFTQQCVLHSGCWRHTKKTWHLQIQGKALLPWSEVNELGWPSRETFPVVILMQHHLTNICSIHQCNFRFFFFFPFLLNARLRTLTLSLLFPPGPYLQHDPHPPEEEPTGHFQGTLPLNQTRIPLLRRWPSHPLDYRNYMTGSLYFFLFLVNLKWGLSSDRQYPLTARFRVIRNTKQ